MLIYWILSMCYLGTLVIGHHDQLWKGQEFRTSWGLGCSVGVSGIWFISYKAKTTKLKGSVRFSLQETLCSV